MKTSVHSATYNSRDIARQVLSLTHALLHETYEGFKAPRKMDLGRVIPIRTQLQSLALLEKLVDHLEEYEVFALSIVFAKPQRVCPIYRGVLYEDGECFKHLFVFNEYPFLSLQICFVKGGLVSTEVIGDIPQICDIHLLVDPKTSQAN